MDLNLALAFFDHRTDTGRRQNAAEAGAAGANALNQGALRHQIDANLAGDHVLLRFGVEADMARHHLRRQARGDDLAQSPARPGPDLCNTRLASTALP